jgi:hypothetical protein
MTNPQPEQSEKTVQLITHVPASVRQRYKVMAALKGVKMSTLQSEALEQYITTLEDQAQKVAQVEAIAAQG